MYKKTSSAQSDAESQKTHFSSSHINVIVVVSENPPPVRGFSENLDLVSDSAFVCKFFSL